VNRLFVLACLLAVAAPSGCGLGEGDERDGAGAQVRVTRDFGKTALDSARVESVREDQTVLRLLQSNFNVGTRFGGRFVDAIDGLESRGPDGQVDWFYFVNGVEAEVGAAEFELSPGDRVQWDRRDWRVTMRVPAIVGAFPEPFLNGLEGKRRPVRVECEDSESRACRDARDTLEREGVSTSGSSLGAPGVEEVTRLAVAQWPAARIVRGAGSLEQGPEENGVFVRVAEDGDSIDLLDERGEVARTVRPGDGVGLVLAMRPLQEELVWLVTALDEDGLEAGVRALDEGRLRDAFAVAADDDGVDKLPLAVK
jgi:Domain of unknown function (DUF4430)